MAACEEGFKTINQEVRINRLFIWWNAAAVSFDAYVCRMGVIFVVR